MQRWVRIVVVLVVALGLGACGGGGGTGAGSGGEERTVLVDYHHDELTSSFLRYYPEKVKVRPGDSVRFEQAWNGEAHSVTMGKVIDQMFEYAPILEKYKSEEEARAGGVTEEELTRISAAFAKVPGMLADDYEIYQPGAQPCYIDEVDDVPAFSTADEEPILDAKCPTKGKPQPAFNGRQGLYNSGFIPPEGDDANTFVVPIAPDAEPGTYQYFCNYHWVAMSGTVEIVAKEATIPSQLDVSRQARKEVEEDAKVALAKVEEAKKAKDGKVGDLELPLAGREADEDYTVVINEFLPERITSKAGQKVTWTFDGITHTVSFNVPKYFPIFTVAKDGTVVWNPQSYEPVGWEVAPRPNQGGPPGPGGPEGRKVDVGTWDGKGGFRSSGALDPGETFSVTFSKPGTYSYACVLHPQMVGTLVVNS